MAMHGTFVGPGKFDVDSHRLIFPQPPMDMPYERSLGTKEDFSIDDDGCIQWSLPVYVRAKFWPLADNTECFWIVTKNRLGWDTGDGITAQATSGENHFSFRTEVFGHFPEEDLRTHVRLKPQEWNEMALALTESHATYWVNGTRIATMRFADDLPSLTPYIGVYGFTTAYSVRNFDATRDPELLSALSIRCISLVWETTGAREGQEESEPDLVCFAVSGAELSRIPKQTLVSDALTVGALRFILAHELDVSWMLLAFTMGSDVLPAAADDIQLADTVALAGLLSLEKNEDKTRSGGGDDGEPPSEPSTQP